MKKIIVYNRYTDKDEEEKIYGDFFVRFLYQNPVGRLFEIFFSLPFFSYFYGFLQNLPLSAGKVPNFIKKFHINMDEYLPGSLLAKPKPESYINFNEFFIRKFRKGMRSVDENPKKLVAFSEGRYLGYAKVDDDFEFPVKGKKVNIGAIFNNDEKWQAFRGGPMLIARLCPVDYHRFHYPADGQCTDFYKVSGRYHSVNPLALNFKNDIFIKNERVVSILNTPQFGKLGFIEVGATCVGRIVQTHEPFMKFSKGDEKGYFLFGGSTVILCGEPGKWLPSPDILEQTTQGKEVFIKLGDSVGEF
ncbi:MAG: phosphatidylserine decarboxylase [Halobacteriovoraceae bacterium]|nr:phosphatidylserine decarboxylase [Halobacteriovoraceae bacterium]MCB9095975.1 phosphatidylserine decarboxylase [Halobacteriovoraceae bacterium]